MLVFGELHAVFEKFFMHNSAKCLGNRPTSFQEDGVLAKLNGRNVEKAIVFSRYPRDFWQVLSDMKFEENKILSCNRCGGWGFRGCYLRC